MFMMRAPLHFARLLFRLLVFCRTTMFIAGTQITPQKERYDIPSLHKSEFSSMWTCWNLPHDFWQIVYELPITSQWTFDVAWCPRNPAMLCTSSFDGHVSVFSLMGGSVSGQQLEQQKVKLYSMYCISELCLGIFWSPLGQRFHTMH